MNKKLKDYIIRMILSLVANKFYKYSQKSLNASTKDINEFLKNQEINQINKKNLLNT